MANLAASKEHPGRKTAGSDSFLIKDATELFFGALVGTDANGYLDKWADTAGLQFKGILYNAEAAIVTPAATGVPTKVSVTGDTSGTPPVEGEVDTSGYTLEGVTVASAVQGSVNSYVYCSTDNPADLTLVATSNVGPVGWVKRFISAGVCDVELLTPAVHLGT